MSTDYSDHTQESRQRIKEDNRLTSERRKQPGVSFPSARSQQHILIVRLNIGRSLDKDIPRIRIGLIGLCGLFEKIHRNEITIEEISNDGTRNVPLSRFNFSPTIGFGIGFFEKLKLRKEKVPKNIYEIPNHTALLDPRPYKLLQTDIIIQLCSSNDFVNNWVLENDMRFQYVEKMIPSRYGQSLFNDATIGNSYEISTGKDVHDIISATSDWAVITDVHSGYQRIDGRNLMGFRDGVSNEDRLNNEIIWTTKEDEYDSLKDGTYMVFNKIEHDLEQWKALSTREQERWVGRSKKTGLLLGTLSQEEDEKLAMECKSQDSLVRKNALRKLENLFKEQNDPKNRVFDSTDLRFRNIQLECPVWSHVRKANPHLEKGAKDIRIFRRGYLFTETGNSGMVSSGLLFICFQRNIARGFEYIKKELLNNKDFPIPEKRSFTKQEVSERHRQGRFSELELKKLGTLQRSVIGLDSKKAYTDALRDSEDPDSQNTGREGLCGPSKLGVYPRGDFLATVNLGGGYYFIPPIPNKSLICMAERLFE